MYSYRTDNHPLAFKRKKDNEKEDERKDKRRKKIKQLHNYTLQLMRNDESNVIIVIIELFVFDY